MKKRIQKLLARLFPIKPLTDTQKIFYNSKVNGAKYSGDNLPVLKWAKRGYWKEEL